ncbi:MAG TPA: hypothetical protein VF189_05325 [Patescibacteria group bacterium]
MARLPKSLTTVTLFSKILATMILVLIIPLASFYAGMQYQKSVSMAQLDPATAITRTQQLNFQAEKLVKDYLLSFMSPKTPSAQRIQDFMLGNPQNIVEKDDTLSFEMTFSLLPTSKTSGNYWLSGNGLLNPNGWIVGKTVNISADKVGNTYKMTSITPVK